MHFVKALDDFAYIYILFQLPPKNLYLQVPGHQLLKSVLTEMWL